jgi:hypothetical protein
MSIKERKETFKKIFYLIAKGKYQDFNDVKKILGVKKISDLDYIILTNISVYKKTQDMPILIIFCILFGYLLALEDKKTKGGDISA